MIEESYVPNAWDDLEGVTPPSSALDLIGHQTAVGLLATNYSSKRLHHAWLLSGPKGIGKATLAYRFAEHLLRYPNPEYAPAEFNVQWPTYD